MPVSASTASIRARRGGAGRVGQRELMRRRARRSGAQTRTTSATVTRSPNDDPNAHDTTTSIVARRRTARISATWASDSSTVMCDVLLAVHGRRRHRDGDVRCPAARASLGAAPVGHQHPPVWCRRRAAGRRSRRRRPSTARPSATRTLRPRRHERRRRPRSSARRSRTSTSTGSSPCKPVAGPHVADDHSVLAPLMVPPFTTDFTRTLTLD